VRIFSWDFLPYGLKDQIYGSVVICGLHNGIITINYRNVSTVHQCRRHINGRYLWVPLKSQSVNNYRYWEYFRRDKELAT